MHHKCIRLHQDAISRQPLLLYADDLVLIAPDLQTLQAYMDILFDFCRLVGMQVNIDKTKAVVFRGPKIPWPYIFSKKGRKCHPTNYSRFPEYDPQRQKLFYPSAAKNSRISQEIEFVDSFRYLGFELHATKDLSYGASILLDRAHRSMHAVLARIRQLNIQSLQVSWYLFQTLVIPIALYACEVWLPFVWTKDWSDSPLEFLQRHFLRSLFHLQQGTSISVLMWEFGRQPLQHVALGRAIKYHNHIISLDPGRLLFQSHVEQLRNAHKHSFSSLMCSLPGVIHVDPEPLALSVLERIHDHFIADLEKDFSTATLEKSRPIYSYNQLRSIFGYAFHLTDFGIAHVDQIALVRFRVCSNTLEVNTGSWSKIPREQRLCPKCPTCIGDERHFLFDCPEFSSLRAKFSTLPFDGGDLKIFFDYFGDVLNTARFISLLSREHYLSRNRIAMGQRA